MFYVSMKIKRQNSRKNKDCEMSFFYHIRKKKSERNPRFKNRLNVCLDIGLTEFRLTTIEKKSSYLNITLEEILLLKNVYQDSEIIENVYRILKEE